MAVLAPHTLELAAILGQLETDPHSGLSHEQAQARQVKYGPNRLAEAQGWPWRASRRCARHLAKGRGVSEVSG